MLRDATKITNLTLQKFVDFFKRNTTIIVQLFLLLYSSVKFIYFVADEETFNVPT